MLATHNYKGTWSKAVSAYIALTDFARSKFIQGGFPEDKIFVKPNYLLALLPCWLALLVEHSARAPRPFLAGWRRLAIFVAAVLAPVAGLFAWQAWRLAGSGGGVEIAPLAVWRLYSPNIPASILLSLAFPLGVLALHWTSARRQAPLVLAWSVLLVAVLQMATTAHGTSARSLGPSASSRA